MSATLSRVRTAAALGGAQHTLRVLVVDDHPIVRAGVRALLELDDGITVVEEAGDVTEAAFKMRRHKPDALVLDAQLPAGEGGGVIERLREEAPGCKVLLLATERDPDHVREALTSGANGYVLKDAAQEELIAAVREISRGGRYVDPRLAVHILNTELTRRARADRHPLSDREREVLRLLAHGHTNLEIARLLFISVRTAERHRTNIMRKLRLRSRSEMVGYALRRGMIEHAAPA